MAKFLAWVNLPATDAKVPGNQKSPSHHEEGSFIHRFSTLAVTQRYISLPSKGGERRRTVKRLSKALLLSNPQIPMRIQGHLRKHVKRSCLSKSEIVFLLGFSSSASHLVSRHEAGAIPSLATAFAYELLFDTSPECLFRGLFDTVTQETVGRVTQLISQLEQGLPTQRQALKLTFLQDVLALHR